MLQSRKRVAEPHPWAALAGGRAHYMAFAKTPKRRKLAVLSVRFQMGLKIQVLKTIKKIAEFQFPAQSHFSA